jgi:hypothetical protein
VTEDGSDRLAEEEAQSPHDTGPGNGPGDVRHHLRVIGSGGANLAPPCPESSVFGAAYLLTSRTSFLAIIGLALLGEDLAVAGVDLHVGDGTIGALDLDTVDDEAILVV